MQLVILAGGLGTRLREETEFKPKPMVEIGGRPIIWHIMNQFASHGISEFVVCAGYRGDVIKDFFLNYQARSSDFKVRLDPDPKIEIVGEAKFPGWSVTVVDTGQTTMTGGRLRRVANHLIEDTFMVAYGDGLSDLDVSSMLTFHRQHGRSATIAAVRPSSRFGVMDLGTDGSVERFREKPQMDDYVNAGIFVFNREVLDLLDDDQTVLEQGPLEHLASTRQLMAFRHNSFWQPMDTYREYLLLNELWSSGQAPWSPTL